MKQASAEGSVVGSGGPAVKPKFKPAKRLKARELWQVQQRLYELCRKLKAALPVDSQAEGLHKLLEQAEKDAYKLYEQRNIAEAQRKDKGEVLWTIYKPRASYMDRTAWVMRTPNLTITQTGYFGSKELGYYVHDYASLNKPWEDLAKALERSAQEFSIEKMHERVAMVLAQPRGSGAAEYGELEREEKARLEKLADCWCARCRGRGWVGDHRHYTPCECTVRRQEVPA